jgi:hypothetical protein
MPRGFRHKKLHNAASGIKCLLPNSSADALSQPVPLKYISCLLLSGCRQLKEHAIDAALIRSVVVSVAVSCKDGGHERSGYGSYASKSRCFLSVYSVRAVSTSPSERAPNDPALLDAFGQSSTECAYFDLYSFTPKLQDKLEMV